MGAAFRAVRASGLIPANVPHEAIVVPPPPDSLSTDAIEVYLVRGGEAKGDVVLGRHWHLRLDDGGRAIAAATALSGTILTIPGANDRAPKDVLVTHLGETPSEMHTYLSLKHGIPIEVVAMETNTRWHAAAETIRLLGSVIL